jgi:molecular chaperone DnaK (HSP70)
VPIPQERQASTSTVPPLLLPYSSVRLRQKTSIRTAAAKSALVLVEFRTLTRPRGRKSSPPEECSAEILKVLFGYLPEEIRNSVDTGTVITVPAAFNQMQKDATMSAADMAGMGKVALMQEPVAAVMSVLRQRKGDRVFLVYDLGGGTLDIALAESISGRVNLLAHGGIAMCGGRDFDRILLDNSITTAAPGPP